MILINHGAEPFVIKRGERIAQMVIAPVAQAALVPVVDIVRDRARRRRLRLDRPLTLGTPAESPEELRELEHRAPAFFWDRHLRSRSGLLPVESR